MQCMTISDFQNPPQAQSIVRVSSACIQCRLRHVKCKAEKPTCSRCQVRGEQCEYQKSRRGGYRPRRSPQLRYLSRSSTSSDSQLQRAQAPSDVSCSDFSKSLSEASSPINSSANKPGRTIAIQAYDLDWTGVAFDSSPSNSDRETSALTGLQVPMEASDELLESYYTNFHPAFPCALPRFFFEQCLRADPQSLKPMLLTMQYVGSLYVPSVLSAPLESQVQEALAEGSCLSPTSAAYQVQALVLYSIAVFWCNEVDRGVHLLNEAIKKAVNLGMHLCNFAAKNGCGEPVLEESWRRTWWVIYITDAHLAGSTHTYPFKTTNIGIAVELPCEEECYALGKIPHPRTLSEYDMREFAEDDGSNFSSFAQLIGLARTLDIVFSQGRPSDPRSASTLAANFDTGIMGWRSLLAQSKRKFVRVDGKIDEHLFRANMLMHTYIVDIHRPLSSLAYSTVESASRCAPPSPPERAVKNEVVVSEAHTSKIIWGIEAVNELLTVSGSLKTHSPFVICMIANTTIAHLSACRYVLRDQALRLAREKIRLNMGVLRALGECWPLAKRTYREVGLIAREILSLEDRDVALPVKNMLEDLPHRATFPFTFDFDFEMGMINYEELGPMDPSIEAI